MSQQFDVMVCNKNPKSLLIVTFENFIFILIADFVILEKMLTSKHFWKMLSQIKKTESYIVLDHT